jgi:acyl dehydratase
MAVTKVIRYQTKPDCADENERLIRAVFAELAEEKPDGLHYASFRLEDGVTFLHLAVIDGDVNPLQSSAAFAEFQSDIGSRIVEGPFTADATPIASYRLLPD